MEDISQSFLSSAEADSLRETAAHLGPNPSFSKLKSPLFLPVFCCLSAESASYFSCNLSLEIAKRNKAILMIDFGLERPNIRYLMGNLVDLRNDFPMKNASHLDLKIETIKLYGFSKITIVSLAVPGEQITLKQTIKRIFVDQSIGEFDIILIHAPNGPDELSAMEPFNCFDRALFLMDSQMHSLLKTYSWIKKFLPACQRYFAGAVSQLHENTESYQQNAAKLRKVISKYLSINPDAPIADIPMDQEAINSIRTRKPLALMESSSVSSQAISNLCENLLSSE